MTAAELNPDLRNLIDARLDAVDRCLIRAQIAWSERRSIVGEVETQVYELLARRSPAPTQEDVLAVLDSLDPPESYIPEELRDRPAAAAAPRANWPQWPQEAARRLVGFSTVALCVAGLLLVNWMVVRIIMLTAGVIPWLVTLAGLVWLNYTGIRRFRAWSATREGNLLDDLRHSLAAWLLPKNGAQAT